MLVTFRPLCDWDLPLLHRWLNEPGVVRWWEGDDVSWEGVVKDYSTAGRAGDPCEHWIAVVDGRDVGWIQLWDVQTEPDEVAPWWALGVDRTAAGIDYLLGASVDRGKGIGASMIRAFSEDAFARHPECTQLCAAPYEDNTASWKALERAGYRYLGDVPDKEGIGRLMVLSR